MAGYEKRFLFVFFFFERGGGLATNYSPMVYIIPYIQGTIYNLLGLGWGGIFRLLAVEKLTSLPKTCLLKSMCLLKSSCEKLTPLNNFKRLTSSDNI